MRPKRYCYVLRPLLTIRYIEDGLGLPPVCFDRLVDAVAPTQIGPGIATLLEKKLATSEMGRGEPIPELGKLIEAEFNRHDGAFSGIRRRDPVDSEATRAQLNAIFR